MKFTINSADVHLRTELKTNPTNGRNARKQWSRLTSTRGGSGENTAKKNRHTQTTPGKRKSEAIDTVNQRSIDRLVGFNVLQN